MRRGGGRSTEARPPHPPHTGEVEASGISTSFWERGEVGWGGWGGRGAAVAALSKYFFMALRIGLGTQGGYEVTHFNPIILQATLCCHTALIVPPEATVGGAL